MKIETKYNIGDTVYIPEYNEEYFPSKPLQIDSILMKASTSNYIVKYILNGNGYDIEVNQEQNIFKTYNECDEWCNKHN